jgi:hypothetical protein
MYAFLIAAPLSEEAYQFFTFRGKKPVALDFRGQTYQVMKNMRFGVRPSSNGKFIRLIFPDNKNRVFTIDLPTARELAKGVGRD